MTEPVSDHYEPPHIFDVERQRDEARDKLFAWRALSVALASIVVFAFVDETRDDDALLEARAAYSTAIATASDLAHQKRVVTESLLCVVGGREFHWTGDVDNVASIEVQCEEHVDPVRFGPVRPAAFEDGCFH
jgi:hypothetical protein